MEKIEQLLSFDDILVVPNYSEVLPSEVNITTRLTHKIKMNIPLLSSAMDTVTESKMAIAMARAGGIGIIHKNLSIESQAIEVKKVKKAENYVIHNPVVVYGQNEIGIALSVMEANGINGTPVLNSLNKVIGIITKHDIRFEDDMTKQVKYVMTPIEVMIKSYPECSKEYAMKLMKQHKVEKLVLLDNKNRLKGLITYKDLTQHKQCPLALKDKEGHLRVGAAVGPSNDMMYRVAALVEAKTDVIVVDTAHGHSKGVVEAVKQIKKAYPLVDVIAGNVATAEGARELAVAGANAIKVGMGPGSICTTRVVSGCGVPQVSAIIDCVKGVKDFHIPVIADGGVKSSGDVVKALACGSLCVMIGSLFAGTDESPGDVIFFQGRKYKSYRGMGSLGAMKKGSKDRYGQSGVDNSKLVPEGVEARVPYKGSVNEVIDQLVGGLRSGMGYTGSRTIEELRTDTRICRITPQGLRESHVHDVTITEESPNYRR